MATHRTLIRWQSPSHSRSPLTKRGREPFLLLFLFFTTQPSTQWVQILRSSLPWLNSASRVARTNRDQVPVVPAAPPLLPSSSQMALPSLPPSGHISSRTRRCQAAAAGEPTTVVDYGFARPRSTPPTVPRPAPTARKPRPPRTTSLSEVCPRPSIDPVPIVPIGPTTDATTPAPPLLGTLPPDAPRRASTPAALPEIPPSAEIEFVESVERCMQSD